MDWPLAFSIFITAISAVIIWGYGYYKLRQAILFRKLEAILGVPYPGWVWFRISAHTLIPLYAAMAVMQFLFEDWPLCIVDAGGAVIWVWIWWIAGGSGKWKKLKKRIAGRVSVMGARLAINPA